MGKKIEKSISLEELPIFKIGHRLEGMINWAECSNYQVRFNYKDLKGKIKIIGYKTKGQILTIRYNDKEFNITTGQFQKCQLGGLLKTNSSDFKIEIDTIYRDNRRDITIIDREYRPKYNKDGTFKQNEKWYKYHCNKDNYEAWIVESSIFANHGCQCCSGHVVVKGINDIPTTASWMIPYFQGGYDEAKLYTKHGGGNPNNRNGNIYPICPNCGMIKAIKVNINNIYKKHAITCLNCSDGIKYPNKFAFKMLDILGMEFKSEYSPDWIKPKAYDFYFKLNNKEYILEMDGGLGHGNKVFNENEITSMETLQLDIFKDKIANKHGVEVIRIDCYYKKEDRFDYIKSNILNSNQLNKLFDLSKVDFNKCNEFALSNRVKEACDLWNSGVSSTKEISEIMNIGTTTAIKWLNLGSEINWCNYNSKLERDRQLRNKSDSMKREIISIEKGIIFNSLAECVRISLKIFGEKLSSSAISEVCKGKHGHTHGFHFKYTSDLTELEIKQIQEQAKLNKAI